MNNPLKDRWEELEGKNDLSISWDKTDPYKHLNRYNTRHNLASQYAWAIPNEEAIETLVKYSPIVEIGAGTGYWASLVREAGGVIFPFDSAPPHKGTNAFRHKVEFMAVLEGSVEVLDRFRDFTLFLCWPPYNESLAYNALKRFKGKYLIYVGEGAYGCNGTNEFFDELKENWKEIKTVRIPQWDGIHDYFEIYERKR